MSEENYVAFELRQTRLTVERFPVGEKTAKKAVEERLARAEGAARRRYRLWLHGEIDSL